MICSQCHFDNPPGAKLCSQCGTKLGASLVFPSQALSEFQQRWLSFHLYYHEDLDCALRGFIHPVVSSLVESDRIESFFFIRYGLGGPHVRLRLKAVSGAEEEVSREVERFAHSFLELNPSTKPLTQEAIRSSNQLILTSDPHESDDSIYPDNFFQTMPFRPEIQRYGGPDRFRLSLNFFALSSVAALEFLFRHAEVSRSAQLAAAFRLLLQQALGFAADEEELSDLLRYGVDWMGTSLPKVVEKGDSVARSQIDAFLYLFGRSLSEVRFLSSKGESCAGGSDLLTLGAQRLSAAIKDADRDMRASIGGSQLHMTATRLGLSNPEEVYLSRLLTVTLGEARAGSAADLSWIGEKAMEGEAGEALSRLVPRALLELPALPGAPPSV